ncbi:MAG: peptidoglycan DD-metalloendopeptidase family protein [Cyanobacteria bacterium P01_B01_bin.77]
MSDIARPLTTGVTAHNSLNSIFPSVELSLSLFPETSSADSGRGSALLEDMLAELELSMYEDFSQFVAKPDLFNNMDVILGKDWDRQTFQHIIQDVEQNGFSSLVQVDVLTGQQLNGANAVFAEATNTIYFSEDFLLQNSNNPDAIVNIFHEEIGHWWNAVLSPVDALGDEGELYRALVQGKTLTDAEILKIKAENDHATIMVHDNTLAVEMSQVEALEFNGRFYQSIRGTDNQIYTRSSTEGQLWSTWEHSGVTLAAPELEVFNDRLYHTVQGTDNRIYTRFTADGQTWSAWEHSGATLDTPELEVFDDRLYQTVRGTDQQIYTRYTVDGQIWSAWEHGGATHDTPELEVFGGRLYQSVRGTDNGIYTRFTANGQTWSVWEHSGATSNTPELEVFDDRLYQTVRGTDNLIYIRFTADGDTWSGWLADGKALDTPELAVFDGHLHQTVRGSDSHVYTRSTQDGLSWTNWTPWSADNSTLSTPTLTAFNGQLIQSIEGADGKIYTQGLLAPEAFGGMSWTPWQQEGKLTFEASEIEAVDFNDRLYQSIRGADNQIYTRSSADGQSWSSWQHGGATLETPELEVFNGRLYQTIRGTDQQIYTRYTVDGQIWSGWQHGGATSDTPELEAFNGRLYQTVRGTDSQIYTRYTVDGQTWSGWQHGGATLNAPKLEVFNGRLYQTVQGTDSQIYTRYTVDGQTWSSWQHSGATLNAPELEVFNGQLYQTVRGTDQRVYTRSTADGDTWSGWVGSGLTLDTPELAAFNGHLYQTIRDTDNNVYVRSTEDGVNWTSWLNNGTTGSRPTLSTFNGTLFQSIGGPDGTIYTQSLYTSKISTWSEREEFGGLTGRDMTTADLNDFNGDGQTDIIWRDSNGNVSLWLDKDHTKRVAIEWIGGDFTFQGTGDFNRDGHVDMMWRKNTGEVYAWYMKGTQYLGAELYGGYAPGDATLEGFADLNKDGQTDLIWRLANGEVVAWYDKDHNQRSKLQWAAHDITFQGTGDFNRDGYTDLMWRKDTGEVYVWYMEGKQFIDDELYGGYTPEDATLQGFADLNKDGRTDAIWRLSNGHIAAWYSDHHNDRSILEWVGPDDIFQGTGDYNGDGNMDLLWRKNTGEVYVWHMNGNQFVRSDLHGGHYSDYQIQTRTIPAKFNDQPQAGEWSAVVSKWDPIGNGQPPLAQVNTGFNDPNALGVISLGSARRADGKAGIVANWGRQAPNNDSRLSSDFFAIRAHTQTYFDGGEYVFRAKADDGYQILAKQHGTNDWFYITPQERWEQAYGAHKEYRFQLAAGNYDLHFHMYESTGDAHLDLSWEKVVYLPTTGNYYPVLSSLTDSQWDQYSGDNTRFDGAIWNGESDERHLTPDSIQQIYTDLSQTVLGQRYRMTAGYLYDQSYYNGFGKWHAGIDFGAPAGTQVKTVTGGTVAWTDNSSASAGGFIAINGTDGKQWVYGHLQNLGNFAAGQVISQGQIIGQIGNQSGANHLHLEVRTSGESTGGAHADQGFVRDATTSPLQAFWQLQPYTSVDSENIPSKTSEEGKNIPIENPPKEPIITSTGSGNMEYIYSYEPPSSWLRDGRQENLYITNFGLVIENYQSRIEADNSFSAEMEIYNPYVFDLPIEIHDSSGRFIGFSGSTIQANKSPESLYEGVKQMIDSSGSLLRNLTDPRNTATSTQVKLSLEADQRAVIDFDSYPTWIYNILVFSLETINFLEAGIGRKTYSENSNVFIRDFLNDSYTKFATQTTANSFINVFAGNEDFSIEKLDSEAIQKLLTAFADYAFQNGFKALSDTVGEYLFDGLANISPFTKRAAEVTFSLSKIVNLDLRYRTIVSATEYNFVAASIHHPNRK